MVAVRSAHLNPVGEFTVDEWVTSLPFSNPQLSKRLARTWRYCEQQCKEHPDASRLLWRGIEMVEILSMLSMDIDSLCAALLFPLVHAGVVEEKVLEEEFSKKIVSLVHGVRDMEAIRQFKTTHNDLMVPKQVDNLRRMLLTIVEDFRCVVIKLAERIAHLRELKNAPENERVLAAKENTNIYAPLANRLGIGQLKWELEDFCFRYLHPHEYKSIAKLLHERRIDREQYIENFVAFLRKTIYEKGVKAEIYGRPKHIYSIWRKMQKKTLGFDELFDIRAARIVVDCLQDCYAVLDIVHAHFRYFPDEFDDYISNPKPNGYQSIHTVVLGPSGKTLEIQIRTRQMHEDAELGVAAHWKYKEGSATISGGRNSYDQRVAWLRKLLGWQEEIVDLGEMLDEVRTQLFDERVYVFTAKVEGVDFPANFTSPDFAYHVSRDAGLRCIGAKISARIAPFNYQFWMSYPIEVVSQKYPNPSRNWLNSDLGYLTSNRDFSKIYNWFFKQERDNNFVVGPQLLELEHLSIGMYKLEKVLLPRYNLNTLNELLASIDGGDLCIKQMLNNLRSKLNKSSSTEEDHRVLPLMQKLSLMPSNRGNWVPREGMRNLMQDITRCCQLIPEDDIIEFIKQSPSISIYNADYEELANVSANFLARIIDAVWKTNSSNDYFLVVRVTANDRSGLLNNITTMLANEKVNVLSIFRRNVVKQQLVTIDMDIEIDNQRILGRVLSKLNQLLDVINARRLYVN